MTEIQTKPENILQSKKESIQETKPPIPKNIPVLRPKAKKVELTKQQLDFFKKGNLKQALFEGQEPFVDHCPICACPNLNYQGILNYIEYYQCAKCGVYINLQLLPYKIHAIGDEPQHLFYPVYNIDDLEYIVNKLEE